MRTSILLLTIIVFSLVLFVPVTLSGLATKLSSDFEGSRKDHPFPKDWYIKSNLDLGEENEVEWPWTPLIKETYTGSNALLINLSEIQNLNEENIGYTFLIYSKTFIISSYNNITFYYKPSFIGECVQVGVEILFPDGESDTTWTFNLDENGVADQGNYNCTSERTTNDWIKISATNMEQVLGGRLAQIYIAPIFVDESCLNGGYLFIDDILLTDTGEAV